MASKTQCDVCEIVTDNDGYGDPEGWYSVYRSLPTLDPDGHAPKREPNIDLCSAPCLAAWADTQIRREHA